MTTYLRLFTVTSLTAALCSINAIAAWESDGALKFHVEGWGGNSNSVYLRSEGGDLLEFDTTTGAVKALPGISGSIQFGRDFFVAEAESSPGPLREVVIHPYVETSAPGFLTTEFRFKEPRQNGALPTISNDKRWAVSLIGGTWPAMSLNIIDLVAYAEDVKRNRVQPWSFYKETIALELTADAPFAPPSKKTQASVPQEKPNVAPVTPPVVPPPPSRATRTSSPQRKFYFDDDDDYDGDYSPRPSQISVRAKGLTFSPDSSKLAFVAELPQRKPQVWIMDMRSFKIHRLVDHTSGRILWLNDGEMLVEGEFSTNERGASQAGFYVVDTLTGQARLVTRNTGGPNSGSLDAVVRNENTLLIRVTPLSLAMVDIERRLPILHIAGQTESVVLSPDAKRLILNRPRFSSNKLNVAEVSVDTLRKLGAENVRMTTPSLHQVTEEKINQVQKAFGPELTIFKPTAADMEKEIKDSFEFSAPMMSPYPGPVFNARFYVQVRNKTDRYIRLPFKNFQYLECEFLDLKGNPLAPPIPTNSSPTLPSAQALFPPGKILEHPCPAPSSLGVRTLKSGEKFKVKMRWASHPAMQVEGELVAP